MKKLIYLLDDDRSTGSELKKTLEEAGYSTGVFSEQKVFFKSMERKIPDLLLLDLWMIESNGIEVLKEVRLHHPSLPVIMISGYPVLDAAKDAGRLNVHDFLEKPLSSDKLLETVKKAFKEYNSIQYKKPGPLRAVKPGNILPDSGYRNDRIINEFLGAKNAKILIVDDNKNVIITLGNILRDEGYSVDAARNGLQALDKIREGSYRIVFMDIHMPQMNGVDAVREIKKIKPETFIVLMTGEADDRDIHSGLAEGGYMCLRKPFSIDRLLQYLKIYEESAERLKERVDTDKTITPGQKRRIRWNLKKQQWLSRYKKNIGAAISALLVVLITIAILFISIKDNYNHALLKKRINSSQQDTISVFDMFYIIRDYLERDERREIRK